LKKAIHKTEICKKTSKFKLKQAQKQGTHKPSKKNVSRNSTKK